VRKPAPRTDGYVELRSYAAIGDGRTVALVAEDGGIDWLPVPNLDSVPIFARLLDAESGGAVELAPSDPYSISRRYVPNTNVLQTTFTTATGAARVTDALVTGIAGRLPWVELARRIDGLRGTVHFRWRVAPGTALGTASPWVEETVNGKVLRVDGVTLAVRGLDYGPRGVGDRAIAGSFTTAAKSRHLVTIAGTGNEPAHLPVGEYTDASVDRTIASWRSWSNEFNYDGPWAKEVQRSALALKLLIFSPTGAIAAAATSSLPENLNGGKNWDYRYAWVRDLAYTVNSLVRFGLREETHAAVAWLLRTIRANGPELHIFYGLDGGRAEGVAERDAPGWRGIGPVVRGNAAVDQLQLGVYGDLFDVLLKYVEAGNVLDTETGRMLAGLADLTAGSWRQTDSGMWELPEEAHHTSSKMGCWQALDSAARLCEMGQMAGDPERWRAECRLIKEWVSEHCWSEDRQSYVFAEGSDRLDASVLLHAMSGFDRGPRMSKTIDALRAELGRGPLLYRFSGAENEEAAFVACSFWLASALACVGRMDEATTLMNELVGLANDVGLFSEMIDPKDGAFLGNLPQGLSHLALINAAINIEELSA
jgi:GH15 family glucan-1,4-alpha-glucosidase